ncbi:hypothetical protein [Yoonia sp. 2307UL14-13]|uniref:hypothetical protein n=1 Tax=Yoonia sp. 2307UL14-13 TaxID=3126506 RepID=UPI0030AC3684
MRIACKNTFTTATVLALSACGGSGGGGGAGGPGDLFFGSTTATASGNGLQFANFGGSAADLDGQTVNIRLPRTIVRDAPGETEKGVFDGVITFDDGQTLVVDGETLVFTGGTATRADGSEVRINTFSTGFGFEPQVFRVLADGERGGRAGEIEFAHFIIGAETVPDAIPELTGSVSYTGNVFGLLSVRGIADASEVSGTINLTATFDGGQVSGDAALSSGGATFDFELTPVGITGNGFVGDLNVTACSTGPCTSDSQIGGVFFGRTAGTIGGILDLDLTLEDPDGVVDDINLVGNAGFVAGETR